MEEQKFHSIRHHHTVQGSEMYLRIPAADFSIPLQQVLLGSRRADLQKLLEPQQGADYSWTVSCPSREELSSFSSSVQHHRLHLLSVRQQTFFPVLVLDWQPRSRLQESRKARQEPPLFVGVVALRFPRLVHPRLHLVRPPGQPSMRLT